jgi:hypothetical protein
MFFPRGKALHKNLATSYVLVDALIDDLCEGGFSGIVEIVLHNAEGHIIIEQGKVAASLLKSDQQSESPASVQELAAKSRAERGRVSIYSYTTDVASALARRADSKPLYTQLSTDFADLGKMLAKLARESDREWLIEVRTKGGAQALIYLRENDCFVVTPEGDTEVADRMDLTGSRALDDLLDESSRAGAMFDVYFRLPSDAIEEVEERPLTPPAHSEETDAGADREAVEIEKYKVSQAAMNQGQSYATSHADTHLESASTEPTYIEANQSAEKIEQPSSSQSDTDNDAYREDIKMSEPLKTSEPLSLPVESLPDAAKQGMTAHLFASTHVAESVGEAEMIEVKRLMSEIARTVEESIRAVSQQSNFAMHMRAGQLRVADRYPFLDPFGNEFEYLAGEIAFVGRVKPDDFIAGLTEALRIALASALQAVSQPARLRAIAAEDLRSLGERYRSEFEEFGLDQSVERIMEA